MNAGLGKTMATGAVALAMLLACGGCDRRAANRAMPPASLAPPAAGDEASRRATTSAAVPGEPARVRPMKKVPILVGGCGGDCSEPAMAVAGFLQATADPGDLERLERFVDTTMLVVDGQALGPQWARMWREARAATRKDSIRQAMKDLTGWTRTLTGEQVRAVLASGPRPVRVWATEAVYDAPIPGGAWRLTLRPRGVEWLVTRIEREPADTAAPGNDGR